MFQLTFRAVALLRHVISFTGEKEISHDRNGKEIEVDVPRTLNGEDSSQRRHFFKNTEGNFDKINKEIREVGETHNALVEEVRKKFKTENPIKINAEKPELSESQKDYDEKINKLILENEEVKESIELYNNTAKEKSAIKFDVDITDKTKVFVKKYYKEFGTKVGYIQTDDEAVNDIEETLMK